MTRFPSTRSPAVLSLLAVLLVLYPAFVYFGLNRFGPHAVALLLVALSLGRLVSAGRGGIRAADLLLGAGGLLLAAFSLARGSAAELLLYPVYVNAALLALFGVSLYSPPTAIERLARLTYAELPDHAISYARRVTQIWCLFFIGNGSIALYTALRTSIETWALYNGVIAYAAMGTLFAVEYLVRRRVMRRHEALALTTRGEIPVAHDRGPASDAEPGDHPTSTGSQPTSSQIEKGDTL